MNKEKHPLMFKIALPVLLAVSFIWFTTAMDAVARHASPLQKLDPILKSFILNQETMAAPSVLLPMSRFHEPGFISAIIKVSGNPIAIEVTGARVRSVIGNILTADVPLSSLNDLIHLPNIIYIQAARQMQPALLDVSVPDTKANQVWQSVPGYTGKGVIVGIIDAGVDWKHPDLKGEDGTSRILYIWDQMVQTPGQYPAGYHYGTEWTKAHIDSGQCQEMDATSHGTHIASIMAGNGGDEHRFTGMAPEANIIAVKNTFADADILDGADYIFRKAAELNRPAVINMSFGSHWGPHDGTELLDQAVDELLDRPGRVIVASAGNDGGYPVHAGTSSLRRPVGGSYPWVAVQPLVGARFVMVQTWYAPSEYLSVRLLLPENENGDLRDLGIGWVPKGRFRHFIVPSGPLAGAEVVIDAQYSPPGLLHPSFDGIDIYILDNDDLNVPIDEYIYAIEYDGAGVGLDAYVLGYGKFTAKLPGSVSFPDESLLLEGNDSNTIISPASASRVICVGSYVTKSEWIDSDNRIRTESVRVDDISVFSSRGPLLDGGRKPDIAAPGEMIVAAFSADGWSRPRSVYRDGEHVSWRGTSMSSPHVAGAAALILQQNPGLTAIEVRDRLTETAVDRGPAGWDKAWGYGKLDTLAAMGIPSAPRGLRATAEDGSVILTWLPNPESDIAGYKLDARYWILDSGFQHRVFNIQHPESSYRLADLPNDMPVSLWLSAYDDDGNEGPQSQEMTITPGPFGPDVTPPEPPRDLTVTSVNTALDLTWSPGREHDLAGYKVYYGTSSGKYDKAISVGNRTEYRIGNLANGERVYVAVSSRDTSGNESGKSEEVSAVPQLFYRSELRYQGGWPVSVGHDVYSSPTLYDTDGDGQLEVSISAKDGKVYLLRHDGRNMPGWPISTNTASVSSPAVGDVDGDGRAEVVVGGGEMIYMWHDDGTPMPGWPVATGDSILASPALGDIDGDGKMEVVVGSRDSKLYAYNSGGSPVDGWPVTTYGPIHSSAGLGDIDGDTRLEVVIGSGDGSMYVFNGDGTMADGWPVYMRSAAHSSPALGDIDGDGGMEVVTADEDGQVYAWHYDGDPVSGWPVDLQETIVASPALGDMDGDRSSLEVVIGTRYGMVYVLKSDGETMAGWPVSVMDYMTSSPALGDINSDGNTDVVVATGTGQHYVGLVYAFRNTGKRLSVMWPAYTEGNICYSSPALGDLDGDGDVELILGSCRLADGAGGKVHAWDLTGRLTEGSIPWGGFRHDASHTGVADDTLPPSLLIVVLQNPVLKKYLDLYIVASEQLMATPELTVAQTSLSATAAEDREGLPQSIPLTQIDGSSYIYKGDLIVESEGLYTFTVSGTDIYGNTGYSSKTISVQLTQKRLMVPASFSLLPNYPNPFNPGTWIPYELAQPADVNIEIHSVAGQLIRSLNLGRRAAGSYIGQDSAAYWDGRDDSAQEAASGVYFCILKAGKFRAVRKMILSK